MKTLLVILVVCVMGNIGTQHIITNTGVDSLDIGQCSLNEVKLKFPGGKTSKSSIGGKRRQYSILMTNGSADRANIKRPKQTATYYKLTKIGIEFYFNFKDTLSSITVWGENQFITDKGLALGKSTFKDVDSLYGTSGWGYSNSAHGKGTSWVKSVKGMLFYSADTLEAKRSDTLRIDHIVISY